MNPDYDGMAPFPKMTVGVMGAAGGVLMKAVCDKVETFGRLVGERGYVLVTGAAPGLPQLAVLGAKKAGGTVVGVSPALNFEEHVRKYRSPTRGYDCIIYTGSGLMGREIENIRTCDVVVFAGGRSGTLGEFAIAYDEGKVIGVLQGTGGVTDAIDQILTIVNKKTNAYMVFNPDPEALLNELELVYRERLLPLHEHTIEDHDLDGVASVT